MLKPVSSFALCFGAKIISPVLSWFSLSKFEHIHSRISERQDVSFIDISLKLSCGSTRCKFQYYRRSNGSPYRGFHKCYQLVSKICSRVRALNLGVHQLWVLWNPIKQNQWIFAVTCYLGMTLSMLVLIRIFQRNIPIAGIKFHDVKKKSINSKNKNSVEKKNKLLTFHVIEN